MAGVRLCQIRTLPSRRAQPVAGRALVISRLVCRLNKLDQWPQVRIGRQIVFVNWRHRFLERQLVFDLVHHDTRIFPQGAAGIPAVEEALLGQAVLGPWVFLNHQRRHH